MISSPYARTLFIEYVLQLHCEYLAELIEWLCTNIGNGVTSLQWKLLKRIFIFGCVENLYDWRVTLVYDSQKDLFPEALTGDLLFVRLTKLHFPARTDVGNAWKIFQWLRYIVIE